MEKRIKVLQACSVSYAVKYIMMPIIKRLSKEGYDVDVLCSDGPDIEYLRGRGLNFKLVPMQRKISLFGNLTSLIRVYWLLRKEKYDVVHVHTHVAGIIVRIAAFLAGVPIVIFSPHGFYFHEGMPLFRRNIFILIEKIMGQLFSDAIIVVSQEDKKTAAVTGIASNEKIVYITNGVNIDRFTGMVSQERKKACKVSLGIDIDEKTVGFVGRLVKEKGILDLVEAFAIIVEKIPGCNLLIVGDNTSSERDTVTKDKLIERIEQLNIRDKVRLLGFRNDVENVLPAMDVFVLPSYREGMPLSILEAMAMELPVVATDIRGCREEVKSGLNGLLVPVGNPTELAKAILKILEDGQLAQSMGKAGRERVLEEFTETEMLDRHVSLFERLIYKKV